MSLYEFFREHFERHRGARPLRFTYIAGDEARDIQVTRWGNYFAFYPSGWGIPSSRWKALENGEVWNAACDLVARGQQGVKYTHPLRFRCACGDEFVIAAREAAEASR